MSLTVLIVTGSIAAPNAVGLTALLKSASHGDIAAVLTLAARKFVTEEVLRFTGLADYVITEDSENRGTAPNHTLFARTSEAIIVYPASAGFIGRIANGLASDVASCLLLSAYGKPRFLFPSMNREMWDNPLVQSNIATLVDNGFVVYPTESGLAPSPEVAFEFLCSVHPRSVPVGGSREE